MTVFAFSTENWRRPLDEVRFLMNFNERLLVARREELHEKGVRVRFIGRRGGRVPARVRRRIEETEELTAPQHDDDAHVRVQLRVRAELVDAAQAIAREVKAGRLDPEKIDERTLTRHLYAPDMPDPDLLVRTSGEFRISNYLLVAARLRGAATSPTCCGPTSAASTCSTRSPNTRKRDRRFGAV